MCITSNIKIVHSCYYEFAATYGLLLFLNVLTCVYSLRPGTGANLRFFEKICQFNFSAPDSIFVCLL